MIEDRSKFAALVDEVEEDAVMARKAAKKALTEPSLPEAEQLAAELRAAGHDEAVFSAIVHRMEGRVYDKERVVAAAALYLGRTSKLFKTKPAAIRALLEAFRLRTFAKERNDMNSKVTPF